MGIPKNRLVHLIMRLKFRRRVIGDDCGETLLGNSFLHVLTQLRGNRTMLESGIASHLIVFVL